MQLSKSYISYYGLMFLILISWHNPFATPPELLRILYLLALLGPLTIKQPKLLAIIIPAFYAISNYSCFISYMRNQVLIYLAFPILALFLHSYGKTDKTSIIFLVFFIITAANNFVNSMKFESISSCCLLVFLWFKFVPNSVNSYAHIFSYAFAIMSLTLSIIFIVGGSAFQMDFGAGGFERTEWMDPNYFGCIVGIGIMASMIEILYNRILKIPERILFLLTIGISFYVLILNGSRGALLATGMSLFLLLIGNGQKMSKKLLIICSFSIFIYILYMSGTFDFLLYRIELDSGRGGSGRTYIWQTKMMAFSNQLSVFEQLFGIGYKNGMALGFGFSRGFHNDYIAILVEYGVFGLMVFIGMLLSPLRKSCNKVIVLSIIVYVAMASSTLEPISGGMIVYFGFLFYACMIGRSKFFSQTKITSNI